MAIIQCENGHYYDDGKYAVCPHCVDENAEDSPTMSFVEEEKQTHDMLVSMAGGGEKTVGYFQGRINLDPVVGWIVCMKGPERGRDYRIHSGRNFVGRSFRMDISIVDDKAVSRENHCSIVYEPINSEFILVPGEGTNTYVNEQPLTEPKRLEDGDSIGIGDSAFSFIAFCAGERVWD